MTQKLWQQKLELNYSKDVFDIVQFGSSVIEGKVFSVFSKPFDFPFPVGNLQFITSNNQSYCLINPPKEIEDEVRELFPQNSSTFVVASSLKECSKKSTSVCFSGTGCNIIVSLDSKSVKKENKVMYYEGALLYGAILSSPELYECQVQRLMKRASELSVVYRAKTATVASRSNGCGSSMEPLLALYANQTLIKNSNQLQTIYQISEEIRRANNALVSCKIF